MPLQNQQEVLFKQNIKEAISQNPAAIFQFEQFEVFGLQMMDLWREYGITIQIEDIKYVNNKIEYKLKAQADENDIRAQALLCRVLKDFK